MFTLQSPHELHKASQNPHSTHATATTSLPSGSLSASVLVAFHHHELNLTVKTNTSLTSRRAQHRRLSSFSSYGTLTPSVHCTSPLRHTNAPFHLSIKPARSNHELPEHKPDKSLMWNTSAHVFDRDFLLSDPVDKQSHKRALIVFPTALSSGLFASPSVISLLDSPTHFSFTSLQSMSQSVLSFFRR